MRVLHVFSGMGRGGAETMIMNLYRTIDREKIQFDFMVHTEEKCAYDDEISKLGGRIYRVPRYIGRNHMQYKKAWYKFFNEHRDCKIIHGHVRSTASIYLKIANKFGLTTIAHSHSTSSGIGISSIVKHVLQLPLRNVADYLFACSLESGQWLFGKNISEKENFQVINNAINTNEFIYDEFTRNNIRRNLNLDRKFVIGHVGRFHPAKNHDFLIEIFREIRNKVNNSILLIVGDGEQRSRIEERIRQFQLEQSIILTGNRPDVSKLLQAMDVFVFPSIWEGLPLTVIEAQTSGLPCFISDKITNEVCISPNIQQISLSNTASEWADIIISTEKIERAQATYYVKESGFDIRESVRKLTTFYENASRVKK